MTTNEEIKEQERVVRSLRLEYDAAMVRAAKAREAATQAQQDAYAVGGKLEAAVKRRKWLDMGPLAVWASDAPSTEYRVEHADRQWIRLARLVAPRWGELHSVRTGYRKGERKGARLDVAATVAAFETWRLARYAK